VAAACKPEADEPSRSGLLLMTGPSKLQLIHPPSGRDPVAQRAHDQPSAGRPLAGARFVHDSGHCPLGSTCPPTALRRRISAAIVSRQALNCRRLSNAATTTCLRSWRTGSHRVTHDVTPQVAVTGSALATTASLASARSPTSPPGRRTGRPRSERWPSNQARHSDDRTCVVRACGGLVLYLGGALRSAGHRVREPPYAIFRSAVVSFERCRLG